MKNGLRVIKNQKFVLAAILIFLIFSFKATAQMFTRPLPKKWVPKAECVEKKTWFILGHRQPKEESKQEIFRRIIETRPEYKFASEISYPIKRINNLIDYIKIDIKGILKPGINIYIAQFDITYKPADLTGIEDKQIILIFAPAKNADPKDHQSIGKYYVITKDKVYSVDSKYKTKWVDNYIDNIVMFAGGLNTTVDAKSKENWFNDDPKKVSDTRSIVYDYDDFKEFIVDEVEYQDKRNNSNVSGIQVQFSSYSDQGDDYDGRIKNKYRLFLQFEFTRQGTLVDEPFYVDDERNFFRRRKKTEAQLKRDFWTEENYNKRKTEKKVPVEYDTYEKWLNAQISRFRLKGFDHSELCPDDCPTGG